MAGNQHLSPNTQITQENVGMTFQDRCGAWLDVCFGADSRSNVPHRNARFLEEAVELVQASGMDEGSALDVVRYVFTRPQGDVNQEVGGVMMTLAAHCLATGEDMTAASEKELARCWTKVDVIRAKEAAKPAFRPALSPPAEGVKMLVDDDWLQRRIATDPDGDCEAGTPTPAPVDWERVGPKLVEALERIRANDPNDPAQPWNVARDALDAAQPQSNGE